MGITQYISKQSSYPVSHNMTLYATQKLPPCVPGKRALVIRFYLDGDFGKPKPGYLEIPTVITAARI